MWRGGFRFQNPPGSCRLLFALFLPEEQMRTLSDIVKREIEDRGGISFRRFVELSLFHPRLGYYSSGRAAIGKGGDFYTAPSVHRSFGETLSRFADASRELLGEERLGILEFGASNAGLALDVLDALRRDRPDVYGGTDYAMVETSVPAVGEARRRLAEHGGRVRWVDDVRKIGPGGFRGVVIANEFLDSLPFHRLRHDGGGMKEVFLGTRGGEFEEILADIEDGDAREFSERYFGEYAEGEEAEARPLSAAWLGEVGSVLDKGFVLVVDYGFLAPELYSRGKRRGTFRCFYRHELCDDPYTRPGEQDITADVNFSELIRAGNALGLDVVRYATQGQFLADWGILDILEKYGAPENQADRLAVKTLIMPEFMGSRFKALVLAKGFSKEELSEFYTDAPIRITPKAL